jgi:hypothetical protein
MTDTSQFFQFRAGVLTPIHEASALEVQLEVADSWLVEDGKCRSLRAHLDSCLLYTSPSPRDES